MAQQCFCVQRSFRAAKSPLRTGHHHGAKGGSFFHRRLSTKSPNRGSILSATEINLGDDRRRSSNVETQSSSSSTSCDATQQQLHQQRSPELSKVKSTPCTPYSLPRSPSQPQQGSQTSCSSSSCATAAPPSVSASAAARGRRPQLGQSLSVDNDVPMSATTLPEIVISGRDDHLAVHDDLLLQHRKGSASSEGSSCGRKSPREKLVHKMSRVFK